MDSNRENKDNGFLEETIKKDSFEPKNIARKSLKFIGCGILLGIGISIGYVGTKPFVKNRISENRPRVSKTLPEETCPFENEQDFLEDRYMRLKRTKFMGIKDISTLNDEIRKKFHDAEKSMVEVSGYAPAKPYEKGKNPGHLAGVILSMTDTDIYIGMSGHRDREAEYTVKFSDYDKCLADAVSSDGELDLTILKVKKSDLNPYTLKKIKSATLPEKYSVENGDVVFAMGAPFGTPGGYTVGMVSSRTETAHLADGEVGVIATNLPGSEKAGGVLLSENGYVIGFIEDRVSKNVLSAYACQDVMGEVEKLLRGEKIPYMGIRGCEIPEKIRKREGLPNGVYVENLDKDSPAIKAGLKTGDIIVGINKKDIRTLNDLHRNVMELRPGEKITVHAKRSGTEGFEKDDYLLTTGERN